MGCTLHIEGGQQIRVRYASFGLFNLLIVIIGVSDLVQDYQPLSNQQSF